MTVIYGLIFGMFLILRPFLLGLQTASISTPFWGAIALLGALGFYLSSRTPLSLERLRFLELMMVISLASFLAFYQARALIDFSLERDQTRAPVGDEEFRPLDVDIDTHLWDLRPQELAPGSDCLGEFWRWFHSRPSWGFACCIPTTCDGCSNVAISEWSP